nr:hypothetical protein RVX_2193 [Nitratidesulfovibrio sp. HK-II]
MHDPALRHAHLLAEGGRGRKRGADVGTARTARTGRIGRIGRAGAGQAAGRAVDGTERNVAGNTEPAGGFQIA